MGIDRRTASVLALAAGLCAGCGRTELWPALQPVTTGDGGVDAPASDGGGDGGGKDAPAEGHADAHPSRDPCTAAGNACGAGQRCVAAPFRQLPGVPGGSDLLLTLGDLNNDRLVDLVTVSPSSGSVSVWINDATTGFRANGSYNVGAQPFAAAIGDFTGDGIPDIAVATFSSGEVTMLVGGYDGTFRMGFFAAVGAMPRAMAAADLNNDGRLDLAIANQDQSRPDDVTIMSSIGNGAFVPGGRYGSQPNASAIVIGDFNNDGQPDIAAASATDSSVTILYGGDLANPAVYTVPSGARSLAVADFDGDGVSDLAVAGNDAIAIFLGGAGIPLREGSVLSPAPNAKGLAAAVAAGDFDGDGDADIAFADGQQLYVFLNVGGAQFQPARALLTPDLSTQPTQLAAGDLDGDGVTDLLVGSVNGEIVRFLSTANGLLIPAPSVPITGTSYIFVTGDFDGDGNVDVAVAEFFIQVGVLQLFGDGQGSFPRSHFDVTGPAPWPLAGDLDGDGRSDLLVFNGQEANVNVQIARSDGTLGDPHLYPIGRDPSSFAVLDANEDGHLDLAVAGSGLTGGLALLIGNGDGSLQAPVELAVTGANAMAVGDVDSDGHLDIVLAEPSGVQVFFGDGRGHFAGSPLVSMNAPLGVLVGDVNGDGRPDVVAFSMIPNGIQTVLVGRDRTLVAVDPTHVAAPDELFAAGGDFNGDGLLDVAFETSSSTALSLALGKGDGTFHLGPQFPGLGSGKNIAVADLNNDGRPDVVAVTGDAQSEPAKLAIWLGAAPFECR